LPEAFRSVPGIRGVRLVQVQHSSGFGQLTMARARPAIRELVRGSDIVHLHGVWDPILFRTAEIARELGVPFVVRPAGMLDPWSLRQRGLKKRLAMALGYRRMLGGAAFIQALNVDERDMVRALRLKCPIEVVPNGTFAEWIDSAPERGGFRERHPAIGDRPFVIFLSRLHHKKGLDHLAAAFRIVAERVPEAMLVVAGPDEGAQGAFVRQVRGMNLADRVVMTGPLYAREKFEALVDATCFCLPSRQEGFSVAVIEALSLGTPVVISPACHFPEVDEAGAGATVELKAEAIAGALVRVLGDPGLRQRQSVAAVTLIRERYTWPRIVQACLAAYERAGVREEVPVRGPIPIGNVANDGQRSVRQAG
jgi:glycosyltransferase involved in cell wall biosynthesis